jgi:copper ion binding protein
MSRQVFTVTGMSCEHCVRAVTEEVQNLPGVRGVEVDLASGQVTVEADDPVDAGAFAAAVDEAGYEVAGTAGGPGAASS